MNEIKYPSGCKEIEYELPNDELIRRLKKIQVAYQNLEQNSHEKYKELALYLGSDVFLENENEDVQLLVACCLADIFRVFSPECPYQDARNLKNIFYFLANQLKGLRDHADSSFRRYLYLLENLECVHTFHLCLDLEESQEIIGHLTEVTFKIICDKHNAKVKALLFDLLNRLLNEPDQLAPKTCECILSRIIEPQKSNNKDAYQLAVDLIKKGGENFEFYMQNFLSNLVLSCKTDQNASKFMHDKLCLIVYELHHLRASLLELALPQLEYKLKSSDLKERREFTKILSKMFSEENSKLTQQVPSLWDAYLERFSDESDDVRKICAQSLSDFLLNHDTQDLKDKIQEMTYNLSIDKDENIRFECAQELFKAFKTDSSLIDVRLLGILRDRCLDVRPRIRKAVLQGLANLYKKIHASIKNKDLFKQIQWLPSKMMRAHYLDSYEDKLLVERLSNTSLVPYTLSTKERMIQFYYIFTTLDDVSIMSLLEIIRERIWLNHSMKLVLDALDENQDETNDTIRKQINFISKKLFDVQKGHEFMKALLKLFNENLNLRAYFKNFVDPTCSCTKSFELSSLILNNMNTLSTGNINMAKRLLERMSSIIIDEESILCLLDLVESNLMSSKNDPEASFIEDNGEKGLSLVNLMLKLHQNRFSFDKIFLKLNEILTLKKERVASLVLKMLSSYFTNINFDSDDESLEQFKVFVKNGTPKEAKYALRFIHLNFINNEEILDKMYKEIMDEMSIKNDKTYITHLVTIGHLCVLIPNKIGLNLKAFITTKVYQELFNNKDLLSMTKKSDALCDSSGKWCENDSELTYETRAQIEGIKLMTRWILSLKNKCPLIQPSMRLFGKILNDKGDLNQSGKSEPEKSRLRLVCATQLLKIAQHKEISMCLTPDIFHALSKIMLDPVSQVREIFMRKLSKAFANYKLTVKFLSLFALCGFDTNRERKNRFKKSFHSALKIFNDYNKCSDINTSDIENTNVSNKNLPENCVPYVISLLAHNVKIDSIKDESQIRQLKECLHFVLDALLEQPDSYQIAYMKEILNEIKNNHDGIALAIANAAKPEQKLAASNNLLYTNRRLYTISEIAYFIIHSSKTHFHAISKDAKRPLIQLPNGYFTKKETSEMSGDDDKPNADLNKTLAQLNDEIKDTRIKQTCARKRKVTTTEEITIINQAECDDEDNDDCNSDDMTLADLKRHRSNSNLHSTKIHPDNTTLKSYSSGSSIASNDDTKRAKISHDVSAKQPVSNSSIVSKELTAEERASKLSTQRASKRLAAKTMTNTRTSDAENEDENESSQKTSSDSTQRSLRSRSKKL